MALSAESKNSLIEQISLIDILYKDEYRVESYIAQIMHGLLKRKKIQDSTVQTNIEKISGGLMPVLSGDYTKNNQDLTLEELNIIPHDHNVIVLLDKLDLSPIEILSGEEIIGRLIWLKCRLAIRDFKKFNDFVPAISNNAKMFNMTKKMADDIQNQFKVISKIIPLNVEVECFLKDNSVIRGILKEQYLLTAYQDIVAMYGTNLPGRWNVVGILDSLNANKLKQSEKKSFRFGMDSLTVMAESIYREGAPKYSIIPVLIFRGLEKQI